jgi:hypothetical protein
LPFQESILTVFLDTSIPSRLANRADAAHPVAKAAVAELHRRGEVLHVTPQNLIEFRNFATPGKQARRQSLER